MAEAKTKIVTQSAMKSTKGVDLSDKSLAEMAAKGNQRAQIAGVYSSCLKKGFQLTKAARSGAERSGYIPGIMKSTASDDVVESVRNSAKAVFAELKKDNPDKDVVIDWMKSVKEKLRGGSGGGGSRSPLTETVTAKDFFA